jgi:hypothetical protein
VSHIPAISFPSNNAVRNKNYGSPFDKCRDNNNKQWYEYVPKSVETSRENKVAVLWNQQVTTERTICNSKPDIIVSDNEKGTCMFIDFAISRDRNVIKKAAEKLLKYKDLRIEIQRVWSVKHKTDTSSENISTI